jgi:hypothetical protein
MIVYDVTNKASFENVKQWMQDLYRYAPEDVELLLVGNKCDEVRAVDYQVAKEFADSAGIPLIETSAKTSVNVDQAFTFLIKRLLSKRYGGATISMVVNSHTHTHTRERDHIAINIYLCFIGLHVWYIGSREALRIVTTPCTCVGKCKCAVACRVCNRRKDNHAAANHAWVSSDGCILL